MKRRATLAFPLALAGALSIEVRQSKAQIRQKKIVVVGEQGVGKSALVLRFITGNFVGDYDPMLADDYRKQFESGGAKYLLNVFDTVGHVSQDSRRRASYRSTDLFLICFDVGRPATLDVIQRRWLTEIRQYGGGAPWALIGNKRDLRVAGGQVVDVATAEANARANGARFYLECSARSGAGVTEVFSAAAAAA